MSPHCCSIQKEHGLFLQSDSEDSDDGDPLPPRSRRNRTPHGHRQNAVTINNSGRSIGHAYGAYIVCETFNAYNCGKTHT